MVPNHGYAEVYHQIPALLQSADFTSHDPPARRFRCGIPENERARLVSRNDCVCADYPIPHPAGGYYLRAARVPRQQGGTTVIIRRSEPYSATQPALRSISFFHHKFPVRPSQTTHSARVKLAF